MNKIHNAGVKIVIGIFITISNISNTHSQDLIRPDDSFQSQDLKKLELRNLNDILTNFDQFAKITIQKGLWDYSNGKRLILGEKICTVERWRTIIPIEYIDSTLPYENIFFTIDFNLAKIIKLLEPENQDELINSFPGYEKINVNPKLRDSLIRINAIDGISTRIVDIQIDCKKHMQDMSVINHGSYLTDGFSMIQNFDINNDIIALQYYFNTPRYEITFIEEDGEIFHEWQGIYTDFSILFLNVNRERN